MSAVIHRLGVCVRETALESLRDGSRSRQDAKLDGQDPSAQRRRSGSRDISHGFLLRWKSVGDFEDEGCI